MMTKPIIIEYYINNDRVLIDEFELIEKELQDNNIYHQNSMAVKNRLHRIQRLMDNYG